MQASYQTKKGSPTPLGVSKQGTGVNFALFSQHATQITLSLFKEGALLADIPLNAKDHRTKNIWHVLVEGLPDQIEYAYHVSGPFNPKKGQIFDYSHTVSDPYALSLNTSATWACKKNWSDLRGRVQFATEFDWENTTAPKIPIQDLIIYEMHVRGFTQHSSSKVKAPGTYLGMIEKIPYLKKLGINAVELLPIHEFNETESTLINPVTNQILLNYWGYSTVNFFSPMARYATSAEWGEAIKEFKMLVRELHKNQIEVILDVVYNHTAEKKTGPLLSFRGIDNQVYYLLNPDGSYMDFTGCGNTFNCHSPVPIELILDSLRYWVKEMHVDGFRFDLASVFCRDRHGHVDRHPPLVKAISSDPVLSKTKLIAEAWDAVGLYQVGHFPGGEEWCEWNGRYRDVVRRFIKGTDGKAGFFASVVSGSKESFDSKKKPYNSINFVTVHDGFTLRDLVSYQQKHNLENGENNKDGSDSNDSWNCGVEGPTDDPKILELRQRQMRNFIVALMVSIGTPMMLMGDEYGHTKKGNNNSYCHDSELNWFLWDELEKSKAFFEFVQQMIALRKTNAILRRTEYLTDKDVDWHSNVPFKHPWDAKCRFVAYTLKDPTNHAPLYIAFNANFQEASITLPPPPQNKSWHRLMDTSLNPPFSPATLSTTYTLPPYSSLILQAE